MSNGPVPAAPTGHEGTQRINEDEISLWEVLAVLLRRRGVIVFFTGFVAVLAGAFALLRTPSFTTSASFTPQGSDAARGQLLALASQFGVSVGGAADGLNALFYAELLTSRGILLPVATAGYAPGGGEILLANLLEIEEDTEALRTEAVIEWLRESAVSVETGLETGIVSIVVTTEWPEISLAIAERLVEEVSRFNMETRQSQATAERGFIEARVAGAQQELEAAEGQLQAFMQANREFASSPDLLFQYERLQRTVSLRQQVFATLVQAFEQARIAEVRDTPVITILQTPFMPPGPDKRRLRLFLALGLALGGLSGVVVAFVVEAFKRPAGNDPAREDFQRALDGFLSRFRVRRA